MGSFFLSLRRRWSEASPVVVVCVLTLVTAVARRAWVADDAFITLRTVDHFVHGRGLVWNPGIRVQAYTHPLWMFLLSATYAVVRTPYAATLLLSLVTTTAAAVVVFRDLLRSPGARLAALLAFVCSQAFVDYGTGGLENPLAHLLLALAYREHRAEQPSAVRTSLAIGLLAVTRHDLVILVLPIAFDVLRSLAQLAPRERRRAALALFGPLALWTAFSVVYYGVPFPNTAYAKLGGALPRSAVLENGLGYFVSSLLYDPVTPVALGLGLVAGLTSSARPARRLAVGVALYLAYVLWVGGDFMRGRFFSAPLLLAVVLLAERLEAETARVPATVLALAFLGILVVGHYTQPALGSDWIDPRGIADERAHWASATAIENAFGSYPMPHHGQVDAARGHAAEAQRGGESVFGSHTAGLVGFYSGPDVHIVEWFGLTDPLLARQPAMREVRSRPGHLLRTIDEDYMAMVRDAHHGRPFVCHGESVRCRLFEDVRRVTEGSLFRPGRLTAMARLMRGSFDWGDAFERYQRPHMPRLTLADVTPRLADGSAWNGPGSHVFRDDGIAVSMPRVERARALSLTLDANDGYAVLFERDGQVVGTTELRAVGGGGLARRRAAIPEGARAGFDRLVIQPSYGDGAYALGDVQLESAR